MSEMKERMPRGELHIADDPSLAADNPRAMALMERFNARCPARPRSAAACWASCWAASATTS